MTFPKDQIYCVLDYETYSEANLKKVGSYEYSVHPSTEILCLAWRIGTKEQLKTASTESFSTPGDDDVWEVPVDLISAFENPTVVVVAHNALFEQLITRHVLSKIYPGADFLKAIPTSRWVCTAALAAALALPRDLEGAAKALKLPVQKDMEGRRLINKWCKPRKPTKNNPKTRHDDPAELARLVKYCETDVDAEVELFLRTPPLTGLERRVWELDQTINLRGFAVDRPLVHTVLGMIADESKHLLKRCEVLSQGQIRSAAQRDVVLDWLSNNGAFLPDLKKKTVEDALTDGLVKGPAREMLEIRRDSSKTSTAKYQAFELRSRHDSRLRDILKYHGASTGRWTASGVQIQNLPRGSITNTVVAAGVLATGELEMVRLIYGNPMEAFSSCLRSLIVAPKGKILDCADYSAIELRVLFWVARHEEGLKALRDGRPLYEELAADIFKIKVKEVTQANRFVGKQATLGAGFGMGWKKFIGTCLQLGREVSKELAVAAIQAYRTTHAPVPLLWKKIEMAAIAAIENPGKKYTINRTAWYRTRDFLWCELPSGRRLAYYGPEVHWENFVTEINGVKTFSNYKRQVITHWGIDGHTKKWTRQRTWGGTLTENIVQAIARDFMAEAMLRIEAAGAWQIVLSVHDELAAERDLKARVGLKEFKLLMEQIPSWGEGCPIAVEGWSGERYRK